MEESSRLSEERAAFLDDHEHDATNSSKARPKRSVTRRMGRIGKLNGECVECGQSVTINAYINGHVSVPLLCQTCLESRVSHIKELRDRFTPGQRNRKQPRAD